MTAVPVKMSFSAWVWRIHMSLIFLEYAPLGFGFTEMHDTYCWIDILLVLIFALHLLALKKHTLIVILKLALCLR